MSVVATSAAAAVNKSKKMVSLVAKIEYVIINSNWMQEIMAGPKKKLRYSEETFPNTTLAGLEWAIVTKRHLICMYCEQIDVSWWPWSCRLGCALLLLPAACHHQASFWQFSLF